MYVDEVGNPDLASSDNPLHRFLSLTGVIINLDYVKRILHPQMEALKAKYFDLNPDSPVILHRKEIMNAKPPFEVLHDDERRREFDDELMQLLEKWSYTVITVCLDKKCHKDTYAIWRYDPYHYCLAILLERFLFFLEQLKAEGDVIAESRGGKEDMRLKDSFSGLWENGTSYVDPGSFQKVFTSKQLKVKLKSNNISGLQLADIIAHPSRNEILIENQMIGAPLAPFAKKIVHILQGKYYQRSGKVSGYGKKFI
jgi:hypothetical protein